MIRLLTRSDTEQQQLVLRNFDDEVAPPYAILSHTWHEDNEQEVTFDGLRNRGGQHKAGWRKIDFCATQASADGLDYILD